VEAEPRPRPRPPPPPPPGEEEEVEKGIRDCLVALEKLMGFGKESFLPMLPLIWRLLRCAPKVLRDKLSNTLQVETYLVMFEILVQFRKEREHRKFTFCGNLLVDCSFACTGKEGPAQ